MNFSAACLPLALITLTAAALAADATKMPAKDAAKLVAEGKAVLVDCREPGEWKDTGVAAPAVLLPMSDFDGDQKQWKEFLAKNEGKQILLYCRTGSRSAHVAKALVAQGVKAANIGGLKDWTNAGLPTRPADAPADPSPAAKTKK
jgi:rhodanese-related sulfurtransferase